jgi:hypothetical protein
MQVTAKQTRWNRRHRTECDKKLPFLKFGARQLVFCLPFLRTDADIKELIKEIAKLCVE